MSRTGALRRLLKPKTVAVFGGGAAAEVIRQCRAVGFEGDIWAVNPKRKELNGIRCFASVAELPVVPDASFIAAPPAGTIEIVRELAARGASGAVCYAAGFAETGAEGAKLERELKAQARDMAIIGPNCHGFLNYLDGVALWPDQHGGKRSERGVGLVLQSGNIGINLTMQRRGLDFAYVITIGNKCVLGLHDYIDALLDDPRVTAIGLHIESIDDVHAFSEASIRALKAGIPIVAMKTGRSTRGAELTLSHTASLAGSDRLYDALFKRLGIARCHAISQFLETLKFVSTVGALPEPTAGSLSCSGGEASLIADGADALGLEMPKLSQESAARIRHVLGSKVHVGNPLDYHTYAWGDYEKLNACFTAILENRFACSMLVLDYPPPGTTTEENWRVAERALIDAARTTGQRAVIVSSLPETLPEDARRRLKEAGMTAMQGIEDCLYAMRAAAEIGRARQDADAIQPVLEPARTAGAVTALDEWASKTELGAFGLPTPPGRPCAADETAATADELGYPVVLKALSTEIAHKSEIGAVAVGLRDAEAVKQATTRMRSAHDRFLVEKMMGPTVAELIIGVSRDPAFGLTLLIGAGGTLVELVDDTVSLLLPVQRHEVRTAIESLKAARLIGGFRGGGAGDLDAVVDAVAAIADYALANNATLEELDVNPLIVMPRGAVAVDAFIRKASG